MTDAKESSNAHICSLKRTNEDIDEADDSSNKTGGTTQQAESVPEANKKRRKQERKTISANSSASEICEAFFKCMDFDGNGFIEEAESKILSVVAFRKDLDEAEEHWSAMLSTMDKDHDMKISQEEYIEWWTGRHAKESINKDGTFVEDYARYLLECLQRISSVKVAQKMCDTFFEAIDYNNDGHLEEEEVKNVSRWAFGQSSEHADETWRDMLLKMDTNKDNKISKEEYREYWLSKAKDKIKPDGTFVEGYKRYLLKKLVRIKNGNHRQEQIRKWKKEHPNSTMDPSKMVAKRTVAFLED